MAGIRAVGSGRAALRPPAMPITGTCRTAARAQMRGWSGARWWSCTAKVRRAAMSDGAGGQVRDRAMRIYERGVEPDRMTRQDKRERLDIEGRGRRHSRASCAPHDAIGVRTKMKVEAAGPAKTDSRSSRIWRRSLPRRRKKRRTTGDAFEQLNVPQIKSMPDPQWLVTRSSSSRRLDFIYRSSRLVSRHSSHSTWRCTFATKQAAVVGTQRRAQRYRDLHLQRRSGRPQVSHQGVGAASQDGGRQPVPRSG